MSTIRIHQGGTTLSVTATPTALKAKMDAAWASRQKAIRPAVTTFLPPTAPKSNALNSEYRRLFLP